jgi:hypothetical protein
MSMLTKRLAAIAAAALMTACAGTPVALGTRVNGTGPAPTGTANTITAEACGFQLFLFFPISINDRLARAYASLETQAGGAFITDVQVQESWGWRFVGTSYCTTLQAKAIRPKSS